MPDPDTTPTDPRWVLAAAILGSAMAFLDGSAVNTVLPIIQAELGADVGWMQGVVTAYLLFLSALLLVGGALGDRLGRRRVFVVGTVLFAAASCWCGLAPDLPQLLCARALQGVGGALLVPGSLALITAAYAPEDRGPAFGIWSGYSAVTSAAGQVLGGFLAQHVSWRAIFFLNVPLALAVVAIAARRVPESSDPAAEGAVDVVGAAFATLGLGGLTYGAIRAGDAGLASPHAWAPLAVGGLALLAFYGWERRARSPMLPLLLFDSRAFLGTNGLTLLLYAALGGAFFFLPFDLILVQGYTATGAGLAMLPFIVLMAGLSRWAGGLVARHGARGPLVVGPLIAAVGFALMAVPGVGGSYWTTFFPAITVLGFGMTVTVAPLTTAVMTAVDSARAGVASGVNNAVARSAGLLAVAGLGVVMVGVFSHALDVGLAGLPLDATARAALASHREQLAAMPLPEGLSGTLKEQTRLAVSLAFVSGFRWVSLICAALAVASAGIAALTLAPQPHQP